MFVERPSGGKAASAPRARKWAGVHEAVAPQARGVPEKGPAVLALEGLFPRVPPQMLGERRRLRKGSAADYARVRPFARVHAVVLRSVRGRGKVAGAAFKGAAKPFRPLARARVHRKKRPLAKLGAADAARKGH